MSDLFGVQGAHVLVTGGSSGLGRFFATLLAARGARVTVGARRAEALAKTVDDISGAEGQAQSVVMDVTAAASIESALDAAEARFGPVQIVINNAGVTATRPALHCIGSVYLNQRWRPPLPVMTLRVGGSLPS